MVGLQTGPLRNLAHSRSWPKRLSDNSRILIIRPLPITPPSAASCGKLQCSIHGETPALTSTRAQSPGAKPAGRWEQDTAYRRVRQRGKGYCPVLSQKRHLAWVHSESSCSSFWSTDTKVAECGADQLICSEACPPVLSLLPPVVQDVAEQPTYWKTKPRRPSAMDIPHRAPAPRAPRGKTCSLSCPSGSIPIMRSSL